MEGDGVVGSREGVRIPEVDLVLSRAALVVGALRTNAHPLQHQADLPADRFPPVIRRDVHVARTVIGDPGGLAVFVQTEQIELHLRAKCKAEALGLGGRRRPLQDAPRIPFKGPAVRIGDVAEHPHHLALLRPPRKLDQRGGVRVEQQIGADLAAEALHRRGVKGDPVGEGPLELGGHDRHVVLLSIDVAEGQTDKLDVLLLHELHYFFRRVLHVLTCFPQFKTYI